ncbi:MAG: C45 family autoproteolytic acyltransferase/hydrolase [Planctomycetaceae bacterium]|jgi:acyl transferase domain-containing protein/NAD(P)-dependent dehydrogenase (short-subunit alcohol dehydrogenase family)|nr:C45 family autoproteolytic acyltransferase/hydrolase [Planctomycetaceae bacterium]
MDSSHFPPLAVIGFSCALPDALAQDEFWNLILNGHSSIRELSQSRFDASLYYDPQKGAKGKSFTKIASVFNHKYFQNEICPDFLQILSKHVANIKDIPTDVGYLISLYTAYQALTHAGYSLPSLSGMNIGVAVGLVKATNQWMYRSLTTRILCFLEKLQDVTDFNVIIPDNMNRIIHDYQKKIQDDWQKYLQPDFSYLCSHDVVMNLVRCFGLRGIAFGLDSACSSSLMTIALVSSYLHAGQLDAAIIGGISYFSFGNMVHYSHVSAASVDGSRPFDKNANGFVPGEGCAYAVVKTLEKALADGDKIFGVIRGLGISSDGKGKGLWAPRQEGQELAIRRAYSMPDEIRNLDYIEAHATSTTLGDATELSALVGAFGDNPPPQIYLTSHKANIGHIFEVSGMVGIIKVLLAMQHQTIPPQINFHEPTAAFDWEKSPFVIPTTATFWQPKENRPRTAAVDAFGIGGLNGHVVIEEFDRSPKAKEKTNQQHSHLPKGSPPNIAVIGMGCVLPGAFSFSEFWNLLHSGKDAFSPIPHDRNDLLFTTKELKELANFKAGFVRGYEYDWKRHKIPPNQIAKANPLQFMILGAADEALENAGIVSQLDKKRTAVVVGTRSDSDFYAVLNMILFMPELRDRMEKILCEKNIDAVTAAKLGEAFAKHLYNEYPALDDETGGFTISTLASRITKAYDLMGGATAIDGGLCGSMVALENAIHLLQNNAEIDTVICASGHRSMGYSRFQEIKGTNVIPAEGACAVILRRLEDAKRDGNSIRAIIHGISGASDTNNVQNAVNRAIDATHQRSEIHADQISFRGFISSDNNTESHLGDHGNPAKTTTSENVELRQVGHTGPAAGMVALIKNVLQMERLQTAPPETTEDGRVFAAITNVDSCGMAYHVILERGTPFANLPQNNKNVKNQITKSAVAPCSSAKQDTQKVYNPKVAMFSTITSRLNPVKQNKVAFLFPGQGSQKAEMFRKLAAELPSFAEKIVEIDAILQRLQLPTFTDMVYANGQLLGKDVLRTQLSLLAADTLILSQLEEWGISPDVVLGHSYGEYPALVAAGVWSFETAAKATTKRCEAIVQFTPTGTGMLSTNADETALRRLFDEIHGELYISNRNAPDQTIVAGKNDDLKQLETRLKQNKFIAMVLPVPAAFHSPLVKNVCPPLENTLAELELQPPRHLFLSGVTTRFEADPDTIRENLVEQMTKPVDFVGMIRKAYQTGCRLFVEAGPKKVLTNLAKKILADKNDVQFLTCDDGKEGSLALLQQVRDAMGSQVSCLQVLEKQNKSRECSERNDRTSNGHFSLPIGMKFFEVSGTPYQMGLAYGQQDAERIRYVLRRYADTALQAGNMLPNVKEDIKNRLPLLLTPENLDEIRGIADGAEVPFDALLRHQFSVFPESDTTSQQNVAHLADRFIKQNAALSAGCVHFAGRTSDNVFVHGGNLDLPLARMLPGTLTPVMIVKRESGKSTYAALGIAGHCGSIGGWNEHGICVSTCVLLDYPRTERNTNGMLHTSLVPKILAEAKTLDNAAAIVKATPKTGGWTMIISEISSKRFLHIEYNGNEVKINQPQNSFLQANHSELLQPSNNGNVPSHSLNRKKRLAELLAINADGKFSIDSNAAFCVLRDDFDVARNERPLHRTMNTVCRVDNVFSWLIDTQKQTLKIAVKNESNLKEVALKDMLSVKYEDEEKSEKLEDNLKLKIKNLGAQKNIESANDINVSKRYASSSTIDYETFLKRNTSVDSHSPLKTRDTVTERFINRMVETVVPKTSATLSFPGAVLIYGDAENELASLLAQRIIQSGTKVFRITESPDAPQLSEKVNQLWNESPFYTLFLVNSYDKNAALFREEKIWNERFERGMITPVLLCKYWYTKLSETKQLDKLELINCSRLGGDFGISSQIGAVEGATGHALVKSIFTEVRSHHSLAIHTKTIDHAFEESPETVLNNILREYAIRDFDREIGYKNNRRYTCRMIPTALGVAHGSKISDIEIDETLDLTEWIDVTQPVSVSLHSVKKPVWLITGGARGVTAEIAYTIGKRFGAKLYLIGSSPIPQIDPKWRNLDADGLKQLKSVIVKEAIAKKEVPAKAWEKIEKALEIDKFFQRLKNENIEYEYFSCDVTNESTISNIVSQILVKEKQLDGFIHGAGIDVATRIEKKKEDLIRKTIEIKIKGVANILRAMKNMPPKTIIGMGSTSGRIGSFGQFDYGIANETLSKYLNQYSAQHPASRVLTICWTAWGEIGMGVRPETLWAMNAIGLGFLPPKEAISYLFSELRHTPKEHEVIISAWNDYKKAFPDSLCHLDIPKKQLIASETVFPFVIGNNASARKIQKLLNEKNISDTTVIASGHDIEGLTVVPQRQRQRWFDEIIVPMLSQLERQLASNKPQKIVVLTSITEIPAGKDLLQRLKTIQKNNHFITLKSVDLPLDTPPDVVAQKVVETINGFIKKTSTPQKQPLLVDEILEQTESRVSFRCTVDPKNDTFLLEHQLQQRPILPVVVAMELMAETSLLFSNTKVVKAIRRLKILRGMKCTVDEPYRLTVVAEKTEAENNEDVWKTTIIGDYYNPKGVRINEKCPYFSAQIVCGNRESEQITIPPKGHKHYDIEYPDLGVRPIFHGEPLRGLRYADFDNVESLIGKVNTISQRALFQSRWNQKKHSIEKSVILNPSLLDACLWASGLLHGIGNPNTSVLPDYFENIEIGTATANVGEPCIVCVERKADIPLPMGYRNMVYDFVLCKNSGEVIYRVNGHRATEVKVK